jgi:hypothetical protein
MLKKRNSTYKLDDSAPEVAHLFPDVSPFETLLLFPAHISVNTDFCTVFRFRPALGRTVRYRRVQSRVVEFEDLFSIHIDSQTNGGIGSAACAAILTVRIILQIFSDRLIEHLLFRLAPLGRMALTVEGKRLHAAKAKQAMGQYLASG